jgi:hypothetical protein
MRGDEPRTSEVTQHPVRDCSHTHAGAGEAGKRKKWAIALTPAAGRRTMPHTHQSTAAFERGTPACRRRPLRHEGLATLALRKLNRQPAGVPAALASRTLGERSHLAVCP